LSALSILFLSYVQTIYLYLKFIVPSIINRSKFNIKTFLYWVLILPLLMKISFSNYKRMNEFLHKDVKKGLDKGMSLDNDTEYWHYQAWLEKEIGKRLVDEEVMGVKSGTIEKNIGRILRKSYVLGVSSGTTALQFANIALGIGPKDEVITVSNTYIGSLLAISNTGATPKLVDVLQDTMLIDTGKIKECINEKTKAIMPVHLYGQMANMNEIRKIARKYGLFVIEDAAHAPLAKFNGKLPGELSEAACYSLHPNKNLGAATNGGIIITKKIRVFNNVEKLRNPRSNDPLLLKSHRTPGYLDWIQMIFVKSKLRYLREWTKRRRAIAKMYYEGLSKYDEILPKSDSKAYHVFCDFVIKIKKRDKLKKYLDKKGIQTAVHYPIPLHLTNIYKYLGYRKGDFPISEKACSEILSLPISPFLKDEEVDYAIRNLKSFFKKY